MQGVNPHTAKQLTALQAGKNAKNRRTKKNKHTHKQKNKQIIPTQHNQTPKVSKNLEGSHKGREKHMTFNEKDTLDTV